MSVAGVRVVEFGPNRSPVPRISTERRACIGEMLRSITLDIQSAAQKQTPRKLRHLNTPADIFNESSKFSPVIRQLTVLLFRENYAPMQLVGECEYRNRTHIQNIHRVSKSCASVIF